MTQMSQSQSTTQSFTDYMEDQAVKVLKALVDPLTTMLQATAELAHSTEVMAKSTEEMSKLIVEMATTTKKMTESTSRLTSCTRFMLEQIKGALEPPTHATNPSVQLSIQPQVEVKLTIMDSARECQSLPGSNPNSRENSSAESIVLPKIDAFIDQAVRELKLSDIMPISVRKGMFTRIISQTQRILNQESLTNGQYTDLLMLQSQAARKLTKQYQQPIQQ